MPWFPSAIRKSNPYVKPVGTLKPIAVVAHRTYGRFAGDMAVGTGSRPGIAFHFYVSKKGDTYQFADTYSVANHARGANSWSIGIEVESLNNDDPMTDRQITALGPLCRWLSRTHDIPLTYDAGPVRKGKRSGFIAHAAIAGSNHGDRWTVDEWNRIVRSQVRPVKNVVVPPVVGIDRQLAAETLRRTGLGVTERWVRRGLKYGRICEQQPMAGTLLAEGSSISVVVDRGPAVNIVTVDSQLHVFDVEAGDLWHRWYDPKAGRWFSESVAGPKAQYPTANRQPVRDNEATAVIEYGQLHAFAGRVHAWYAAGIWSSEVLP